MNKKKDKKDNGKSDRIFKKKEDYKKKKKDK